MLNQSAFNPNSQNKEGIDLLETLLQPENTSCFVPYELTKKGRKKKEKGFQEIYNF